MRGRHDRMQGALAVAAALVFLALAASSGDVWRGTAAISDVPVYERYGKALESGEVPYRDFRPEYPPGALVAFVAPALLTDDPLAYARVFAALMTAAGVAMVLLVAVALRVLDAGPGWAARALAVPATTPLLLGPLVLTRFDLLAAAITVGAVAAALAGRTRLAGVVLGVAVAVKLYPLVLLPLLAAWAWRRGGRREGAVVAGLCLAVVAVAFAPFALLAPDGVAWSVWRQLGRPLQIESLGAAVLLALHHAAGMPLGWASSHGSQNLTGVPAALAAAATSVAQVAALAWVWARFARERCDREGLALAAAAAVTAFVALGKVLSPQFLVWLLPLVPLVAGARGAAASALLVTACLLTRAWFPGSYWSLVKEFDEGASWLLLLRDLALVSLLAVLLTARALVPARRPSRARLPDRT
jgi:hypothetical protein